MNRKSAEADDDESWEDQASMVLVHSFRFFFSLNGGQELDRGPINKDRWHSKNWFNHDSRWIWTDFWKNPQRYIYPWFIPDPQSKENGPQGMCACACVRVWLCMDEYVIMGVSTSGLCEFECEVPMGGLKLRFGLRKSKVVVRVM